jgi:hypothetical protein
MKCGATLNSGNIWHRNEHAGRDTVIGSVPTIVHGSLRDITVRQMPVSPS